MKNILLSLAFILFCSIAGFAQKGTAEPGYYPMNYSGDTWTGEVTSIDEDTREFTLTYTRGQKTQTFTAILPKGYLVKMKDGSDYELKMSDLTGMRLTAYYVTKSKKNDKGEKVKTYEVIKIKFLPKDK